jgi:drug/metabolite transporter (DMT)-like permease
MISSILALLTALVWALSVVLIRRGLDSSNFISVSLVITVVGAAVFAPLSLLLTPIESVNMYGFSLFLLAGFIQPGLVRLLYFKGMERVGASVNASIYASYPIFSSLIAAFLLNEELTIGVWLGIVCVVFGAIMVQRAMYGGVVFRGDVKDLIYPFLAAILVGFSYVVKKEGLNVCDVPVMGVAVGYVTAFLLYLPIMFMNPTLLNKYSFKLFWKSGIGLCIGHLLSFYALRYGDVSTVTPLIQVEPLFIFLLIHYYLKGIEKIPPKLVVGAIIIILGAILVVLA